MVAFSVILWVISAELLQPHWVRTTIAVLTPVFAINIARLVWLKVRGRSA